MIAMLFATHQEAEPILSMLPAKKVTEKPFDTYWFAAKSHRPAGIVVITGMGPVAAEAATRYAIRSYAIRHIINAGICGALRDNLSVGAIYRITTVADGDALLAHSGNTGTPLTSGDTPAWESLPVAQLASVSEPVFDGERRTPLATSADLVDMEGYAVLRVAADNKLPCSLIKGISDGAHEGARADLHRHLEPVSEAVCTCIVQGLSKWPHETGRSWKRLISFVKLEHTVFSLPLLFAGAWIGAGGQMPSARVLLLVALAGLGARTLGMAMNRILDRRLDLLNPRTASRDLPSGRMTGEQAWLVAVLGLITYVAACAALGPVCLRLSPIPAIVLIGYSFLKRFTALCHFGIGLALAFGPLGAYIATTGSTTLPYPILILAVFTFLWISGFDIIYALQDLEADRRNGVHSLPAAMGSRGAQTVAAMVHALAAGLAVILWQQTGGSLFSLGALVITLTAFAAAYHPRLPLEVRFFPVSAIAGIAGAWIPILGGIS